MFSLNGMPKDYQLTIHVSNLIAYWNSTVNNRPESDDVSYTETEILQSIYWLSVRPGMIHFGRHDHPLAFRINQLIDSYGKDVVKEYVELFYGNQAAS